MTDHRIRMNDALVDRLDPLISEYFLKFVEKHERPPNEDVALWKFLERLREIREARRIAKECEMEPKFGGRPFLENLAHPWMNCLHPEVQERAFRELIGWLKGEKDAIFDVEFEKSCTRDFRKSRKQRAEESVRLLAGLAKVQEKLEGGKEPPTPSAGPLKP